MNDGVVDRTAPATPEGAGEPAAFRHEALLYSGTDDFVARAAAFVRDGVDRKEPVLVLACQPRMGLLREALGDRAARVRFVEATDAGRNPVRIIPLWRQFIDAHPRAARLRGIAEPVWPGRTDDEVAEARFGEGLLNLAFEGSRPCWLLCPYDLDALAKDVVALASRTHPFLTGPDGSRPSDDYDAEDALHAFTTPLREPEKVLDEFAVSADALDPIRRRVGAHAERFGLPFARARDFALAASEIATNSVRHARGGTMRLWTQGNVIVCEARDGGSIDHPLAGQERPEPGQVGGYGLWLANQLCDLVQIRRLVGGSVVRLHMRRP